MTQFNNHLAWYHPKKNAFVLVHQVTPLLVAVESCFVVLEWALPPQSSPPWSAGQPVLMQSGYLRHAMPSQGSPRKIFVKH